MSVRFNVYDYYDPVAKFNVLCLNKASNRNYSLHLLFQYGIKPIENYPPFLQIMALFRQYCVNFYREYSISTNCKTLFEAKAIVDKTLSQKAPEHLTKLTELDPAMIIAITRLYSSNFGNTPNPLHEPCIRDLAEMIHKKTCALKEIERITPRMSLQVLRQAIFTELEKSIPGNFSGSRPFQNHLFSEGAILAWLNRHPRTLTPNDITDALKQRYSAHLISEILSHCLEELTSYHIYCAYNYDVPENLMFAMLKKCKNLKYGNILDALNKQYSEKLFLFMLSKFTGKFCPSAIEKATRNRYSEKCLAIMRSRLF